MTRALVRGATVLVFLLAPGKGFTAGRIQASCRVEASGLVLDRHEGCQTHYSAQLNALAPTQQLRTVVLEREFPYPPEKLWHALTQRHLIGALLMKSDFQPVEGHRFNFRADWGSVEGRVTEVQPQTTLSYTLRQDEHRFC